MFDLSDAQMHRLQQYDWPGNIRELQNFVERMVITGRPEQALDYLAICGPAEGKEKPLAQPASRAQRIMTDAQMRQMEKANLKAAMERTNWLVYGSRGAAALLGIKPTTLISRLKRFDLYALRPVSLALDEQQNLSDTE